MAWMFVSCDTCVFCRADQSFREIPPAASVCDVETSTMEQPRPYFGLLHHTHTKKRVGNFIYISVQLIAHGIKYVSHR